MKKKITWNLSGMIVYCVAQWAITVIVVRLGSYEDAGLLSLAMSASSTFSTIALFGMRNFQISDINDEYSFGEYKGSRVWTTSVAILLCVVYSFIGKSTEQMLCINTFMIVRVTEAITDVMHGQDQKNDRYDLIGISYIVRGIITIASFSICLWRLNDLVQSILIMSVLQLVFALFFDCRITNRITEYPNIIINSTKIVELILRCAPLVVYSFLISAENVVAKEVLKKFYGTAALGIYSSIASPTLVIQVFASVVFSPYLPNIAELYYCGEFERLKKTIRKIYCVLLFLVVFVNVGALALGKWGLKFLYGEKILDNYYLFFPLVWCTILMAAIWILSSITIAFRKINIISIAMVLDFIFCLMIARPGVMKFGINGASIIQITSYIAYIIFLILMIEISIREKT